MGQRRLRGPVLPSCSVPAEADGSLAVAFCGNKTDLLYPHSVTGAAALILLGNLPGVSLVVFCVRKILLQQSQHITSDLPSPFLSERTSSPEY